jgi:hypothetical protein
MGVACSLGFVRRVWSSRKKRVYVSVRVLVMCGRCLAMARRYMCEGGRAVCGECERRERAV